MEYKEIENQDIYGKPGEQDIFENVAFVNCNFKENLEGSEFIKCRFQKCMFLKDLEGSKFTTCFFDKCNLDTEFNGSRFYKCNITRSHFDYCEGNNSDNIVFEKCEFPYSLIKTNYSKNVAFSECKFMETDIELRDISDSKIIDCYFARCRILFTHNNDEDKLFEITPSAIISNNFADCHFDFSQFPEYLEHNNFIHCSLDTCQLTDTQSCSFTMCDMPKTMFSGENKYNIYRK